MRRSVRGLRIVFVHACGTKSGAAMSLLHMVTGLKEAGCKELVLTPDGDVVELFRQAGINIEVVPQPSTFMSGCGGSSLCSFRIVTILWTIWNLRSARTIRFHIDRFKPEIVHVNERNLFQACAIAKTLGIRTVMHARNVAERRCKWAHRLSIWMMRRYVDQVIAIDKSVARSLREYPHIAIVYNPLPKRLLARARQHHRSGTSHPLRILLLSNLVLGKGIEELLGAIKILRARHDLQFIIVGQNSRPPDFHRSLLGKCTRALGLTPDLETTVKEFIIQNKLEQQVEFHGFVHRVEELLPTIDINVFPSKLNGPSRGVFETGVFGIPSIVAMRDRTEDVVADGRNGIIIPEGDAQALAEAIVTLAENTPLRNRMGEEARRQFLSQFDPDLTRDAIQAVYSGVLSTESVQ